MPVGRGVPAATAAGSVGEGVSVGKGVLVCTAVGDDASVAVSVAMGDDVGIAAAVSVLVGAGVLVGTSVCVGAGEDVGTSVEVAVGTSVNAAKVDVRSGLACASGSAGEGLTNVTTPQAPKMASTRINMVRSLVVTRRRQAFSAPTVAHRTPGPGCPFVRLSIR